MVIIPMSLYKKKKTVDQAARNAIDNARKARRGARCDEGSSKPQYAESVYHQQHGPGQTINACLDENNSVIFYDVLFENGEQLRLPVDQLTINETGTLDSDFKMVRVRLPNGKVTARRYHRRTKVVSNKETRRSPYGDKDNNGEQ